MLVFKVTLPINLKVYRDKNLKRGVQLTLHLLEGNRLQSLSDLQTLERTWNSGVLEFVWVFTSIF